MADKTGIEWTDATWNAIRARNKVTGAIGWHCEHASPGCVNCYSETFNRDRLGTRLPFKPGHRADIEIFLDEAMLTQPLRWRRPRKIFVCSMTDLFADFVSDAMIDRMFAVMALCPQHTFQVLTKRSARLRAYCSDPTVRERISLAAAELGGALNLRRAGYVRFQTVGTLDQVLTPWPLPNVHQGVSAEDQRCAEERVLDLLATPAVIRFVSAEPLLGAIEFRRLKAAANVELDALTGQFTATAAFSGGLANFQAGLDALPPLPERRPRLDGIIVGGESGPRARPMHPAWPRDIRDDCAATRVAFFFKQWGSFRIGEKPPEEVSSCILWQDGTEEFYGEHQDIQYGQHWLDHDQDGRIVIAYPASKKAAGRLLDGREHNDMPRAA